MKKLVLLMAFVVYVADCMAQYEENYTFWAEMVAPDNSNYKIIKKEGFKTLKVVSYLSNDEDDEQKTTTELTAEFDGMGRLTSITNESIGTKPTLKYDYDRKGQVLRYTRTTQKGQPTSFDFVYDRRKGYKMIQSTDTLYQWDTIKHRLVAATDTHTRYWYFHKSGMPEKFVKTYTNKGFNKVVYKADTVIYTYDRYDNLVGYRKVQTNKQGQTTIEELATYTYDLKKNLLKTEITTYDFSFNKEQPRSTTIYTLAYEGEMVPVLKSLTKVTTRYYYSDGSLMNEDLFVDVEYTLSTSGIIMNYKKRTTPPGQDVLYVYTYSK